MLQNFYDGIDPHTASAYAIWGEENYNKQKKQLSKSKTIKRIEFNVRKHNIKLIKAVPYTYSK